MRALLCSQDHLEDLQQKAEVGKLSTGSNIVRLKQMQNRDDTSFIRCQKSKLKTAVSIVGQRSTYFGPILEGGKKIQNMRENVVLKMY